MWWALRIMKQNDFTPTRSAGARRSTGSATRRRPRRGERHFHRVEGERPRAQAQHARHERAEVPDRAVARPGTRAFPRAIRESVGDVALEAIEGTAERRRRGEPRRKQKPVLQLRASAPRGESSSISRCLVKIDVPAPASRLQGGRLQRESPMSLAPTLDKLALAAQVKEKAGARVRPRRRRPGRPLSERRLLPPVARRGARGVDGVPRARRRADRPRHLLPRGAERDLRRHQLPHAARAGAAGGGCSPRARRAARSGSITTNSSSAGSTNWPIGCAKPSPAPAPARPLIRARARAATWRHGRGSGGSARTPASSTRGSAPPGSCSAR